jgi:tungstate transport system permease protein
MSSIVDAFVLAVKLIFTGDPEVLGITARTLEISCSSTFFGALIFVPLGCLIHFNEFRGKRLLVNIIQSGISGRPERGAAWLPGHPVYTSGNRNR